MTQSADIVTTLRVVLPDVPDLPLSRTQNRVWLTKAVCADVCALRTVPSRLIDVLLTERRNDRSVCVCEVGRKTGRYDGAVRDRLAFRWISIQTVESWPEVPPAAVFTWSSDGTQGGTFKIAITSTDGRTQYWAAAYGELKADLVNHHTGDIVWWQANRYYPFLVREAEGDVRSLALAFRPASDTTLAEANREASRLLYELARCMGWRKLTLRERDRLGLQTGQWVRESVYADAQGRPSAVGEVTEHLARADIADDVEALRRTRR